VKLGFLNAWAKDILNSWDVVAVSEDLHQVTNNWSVSVSNDVIPGKTAEDLVDLWAFDDIVDIDEAVVGWETLFLVVVPGVDGVEDDGGVNTADNFLHVMKGKSVEDPVHLVGDVLVDQHTSKDVFLDFAFSLSFSHADLSLGKNTLINLDIDNSWFSDDFGFPSHGLNNFLADRGELDIGDDFSDISNNGGPDGVGVHVTVHLVQKVLGGEFVEFVEAASEDWGVPLVVGGVVVSLTFDNWVFGVNITSEDSVPEVLNVDFSVEVASEGFNLAVSIWGNGVNVTSEESAPVISNAFLSVIDWTPVVVFYISAVVGGDNDAFSDDLNLGVDVLVEEDWVAEVRLEFRDGPELLEEGRLHIAPEDNWVLLPELTEKWDPVVLLEEGVVDKLLQRHNSHSPVKEGSVIGHRVVSTDVGEFPPGDSEAVSVGHQVLLLQKQVILVQEWLLFCEHANGVHVHAASSGNCHKGQHYESFHCRER